MKKKYSINKTKRNRHRAIERARKVDEIKQIIDFFYGHQPESGIPKNGNHKSGKKPAYERMQHLRKRDQSIKELSEKKKKRVIRDGVEVYYDSNNC